MLLAPLSPPVLSPCLFLTLSSPLPPCLCEHAELWRNLTTEEKGKYRRQSMIDR